MLGLTFWPISIKPHLSWDSWLQTTEINAGYFKKKKRKNLWAERVSSQKQEESGRPSIENETQKRGSRLWRGNSEAANIWSLSHIHTGDDNPFNVAFARVIEEFWDSVSQSSLLSSISCSTKDKLWSLLIPQWEIMRTLPPSSYMQRGLHPKGNCRGGPNHSIL